MCYHAGSPSGVVLKQKMPNKVHYNSNELFHVRGFARPYLPVTLNNDVDSIVSARWKLLPF